MGSSVRGRDVKDTVKSMRDRARYDIAYARDNSVNKLRVDTHKSRPAKGGNIKATNYTGLVIKRGSDEKDVVKNARNRSQTIKAHSLFINTPPVVDAKINAKVGGPF